MKKLRDQHKGMVTCRLCKGDHWTSKCPYKDSLGANSIQDLEESGEELVRGAGYGAYGVLCAAVVANKPEPPTAAAAVASGGGGGGASGGKYVPPNRREGEGGRRGETLGSRMNRDGT